MLASVRCRGRFSVFWLLLWWIVHFCLIDVCSFCCYILWYLKLPYFFFKFIIFCCCLSSLALLVLEKARDRLFPCFLCLLVGLIDRSLSCMFGLVLLSKLVIKFCLVAEFWLFLNISAYADFSLFSVSSIVVAFIYALGLYFELLNFLNFRWSSIFFVDASFTLTVFSISSYSFFRNCCLIIPSVWSMLMFVSLIVLLQKETASSTKFKEKSFSMEYQLSIKLWS